MSGIKADWRLAELIESADDPFDTVIFSSGLRVDLTGADDEIFAGLRRTLKIEGRLFNRGVVCAMKDAGQDCLACPHFTANAAEERSPLCLLGRDQRTIEKEMQARKEPVRELAGKVEEWSEIGHLNDEYAELLTAVGL